MGSEYLYNNTPQYRLYDTIFTGYNNKLRPRYHPEDPVEVGLEFELNTVSGLVGGQTPGDSGAKQSLRFYCFVGALVPVINYMFVHMSSACILSIAFRMK